MLLQSIRPQCGFPDSSRPPCSPTACHHPSPGLGNLHQRPGAAHPACPTGSTARETPPALQCSTRLLVQQLAPTQSRGGLRPLPLLTLGPRAAYQGPAVSVGSSQDAAVHLTAQGAFRQGRAPPDQRAPRTSSTTDASTRRFDASFPGLVTASHAAFTTSAPAPWVPKRGTVLCPTS
ncbi:hypothetical protein NDU88_007897 [Pleurodeles waltl]|uniref:Uncharacterized protein n=1 Tax=Pleurodeles waltl TaxID=8319 RepID=A0AAV7NUL6_PLEWA|nr:hypothetical protein NDU88_007897 [Pleurodeles waltl]